MNSHREVEEPETDWEELTREEEEQRRRSASLNAWTNPYRLADVPRDAEEAVRQRSIIEQAPYMDDELIGREIEEARERDYRSHDRAELLAEHEELRQELEDARAEDVAEDEEPNIYTAARKARFLQAIDRMRAADGLPPLPTAAGVRARDEQEQREHDERVVVNLRTSVPRRAEVEEPQDPELEPPEEPLGTDDAEPAEGDFTGGVRLVGVRGRPGREREEGPEEKEELRGRARRQGKKTGDTQQSADEVSSGNWTTGGFLTSGEGSWTGDGQWVSGENAPSAGW